MTEEYKVKCPECHKAVTKRGLKAHIRMAHPKNIAESIGGTESVLTEPEQELVVQPEPEKPSPEQATTPSAELDAEKVKAVYGPLMEQIAQSTFEKGMSMVLERLPGMIETQLQGMLEQARAQMAGQGPASPTVEQPNPTAIVEGQPAAGGDKLGQVMGLMEMAQRAGLIPNLQQQQSPIEAVTKMLGGLGDLFAGMDKVRGGLGSGSTMGPQAALSWMKWGYDQGKAGAPSPDFPTTTTHVPPSTEMGKEGGQ